MFNFREVELIFLQDNQVNSHEKALEYFFADFHDIIVRKQKLSVTEQSGQVIRMHLLMSRHFSDNWKFQIPTNRTS